MGEIRTKLNGEYGGLPPSYSTLFPMAPTDKGNIMCESENTLSNPSILKWTNEFFAYWNSPFMQELIGIKAIKAL